MLSQMQQQQQLLRADVALILSASLDALHNASTRPAPFASASAENIPDDVHLLGNVLRSHLMEILEPIMQHPSGSVKSSVDNLATEVTSLTASYNSYHPNRGNQPSTGIGVSEKQPRAGVSTPHPPASVSEGRIQHTRPEPSLRPSHHVKLFSIQHKYSSALGVIRVVVTKFRTRANSETPFTDPFFRLTLTIAPAPWLSHRGFSLQYSTGTDSQGYCNILPGILSFRIHLRCRLKERMACRRRGLSIPSWSHPIWEVIDNDDVEKFQQMLRNGEVSWRDQDQHGFCLFKVRFGCFHV